MEIKNPVEKKYLKMSFFEKFWYSITKFEKYPEMAAAGVKKSIIYFAELMIVFSIIVTMAYVYYVQKVAIYEEENLTFGEKIVKQIEELSPDEALNESMEILSNYPNGAIVATFVLSVFLSFFVLTFIDVLMLTVFGLFTCFIAKIKMSYKLLFNMSVFALTLSITLKALYMVINLITEFQVKYFDMMYIAIAYIYLAAAIFMIKSDIIKQQIELMRVIQEGKEKIEQVIPKKPKDEGENEEEEKEKDDLKKEKNDPEGQESNA